MEYLIPTSVARVVVIARDDEGKDIAAAVLSDIDPDRFLHADDDYAEYVLRRAEAYTRIFFRLSFSESYYKRFEPASIAKD